MTPDLKAEILCKCEFDRERLLNYLEKHNSEIVTTDEMDDAKCMIRYFTPIIRELLDDREELVRALKAECCCPDETSWTTGKEILCDACEVLTATTERLKQIAGGGE